VEDVWVEWNFAKAKFKLQRSELGAMTNGRPAVFVCRESGQRLDHAALVFEYRLKNFGIQLSRVLTS
jgi:hypothetical protein